MAVRTSFTAGEVLAAADLTDTFGAKANLASPTFTGTPAAPTAAAGTNTTQIATTAFVQANSGKVLQVVRATDTTNRSTTSTTLVDVTGMSVTITPQKSTSAIIILATGIVSAVTSTNFPYGYFAITDSSNNEISGAQAAPIGGNAISGGGGLGTLQMYSELKTIGYATPATISAVTYKLRFRVDASATQTLNLANAQRTGQMFAIEVSA